MNVGSRQRWFQWPVQGLLFLCLLLLPAGTAWALPQSNELENPFEALIQSGMQYYCIQLGPVIAEVSGEDVYSDLARATLSFALLGIDESFFDGAALRKLNPDLPIAEDEELCAVTLPAEALALSGTLTLEIYFILSSP